MSCSILSCGVLATAILLVASPAFGQSQCRDADKVLSDLKALDPSPWACLGGVTLGPAGVRVVVAPTGKGTITVATENGYARDCAAKRMLALAMEPSDCTLIMTWPMSMDGWPAEPAVPAVERSIPSALDRVLHTALALGGPSGDCPDPATQEGRVWGSTWRPIGFSKEGAFAYAEVTNSDMGMAAWSVKVVSLVEDEVLGSVHRGYSKPVPVDMFLGVERPAIEALLATHGVEPAVVKMSPLPYASGGGELSVSFLDVGDPADRPFRILQVTATRSGVGSKRITKMTGVAKVDALGVMVSPFEPRGAVVLAVHELAPEATINCRIRVVGAHLETGFR